MSDQLLVGIFPKEGSGAIKTDAPPPVEAKPGAEPAICAGCKPPLTYHGGYVMGTTAQAGKVTITPIYWVPPGRTMLPIYKTMINQYNNLVGAYQTAGDLTRAIPLYEQTLTDRDRILGPDHPATLNSRNNLAYAYQTAGDLSRAIPLFDRAVADCERVLGPDHPMTGTVRANAQAARSSNEKG